MEEGRWVTINGAHVFVKNGQSPMDAFIRQKGGKNKKEKINEGLQQEHKTKIQQLNSEKYEDGTYDLDTMKKQNLESGYQVSFYQTGVKLSNKEYLQAHNDMIKYSSDGKTYAGKFGGEPEISYNIKNQKDAYMLMKKYNQHSMCKYRKDGKIRFYYNYELDEKKNKTSFGKGGRKK